MFTKKKLLTIFIHAFNDIHPLWYALGIGTAIRTLFVITSSFPIGDGGLFFVMTKELIANNFSLPLFTSYNHLSIPYAYPPFAFYLVGFIHTITSVELLFLFRYVPLFFSVVSIPLFYGVAKQIFNKQYASVAVLLFAVAPKSFEFQIWGGGVTRSIGFFLAILTLFFFTQKRTGIKHIIFAGVFFGLTIMTHLEWAFFTAVSLCILSYVQYRKTYLQKFILVFLIGVAISCPWWITIIVHHRIATFGSYTSIGLLQNMSNSFNVLLAAYFTDEPLIVFNLIRFLSVLGILISIFRYKWLAVWFLTLTLFSPRAALNVIVVPICLMATIAVNEVLRPAFSKITVHINALFFCYYLYYTIILVSGFIYSTPYIFNTLNQNDLNTFSWIEHNTLPQNTFLVLTRPSTGTWGGDIINEWFPALTERQSILTAQGREAISNQEFEQAIYKYAYIRTCQYHGVECLEDIAQKKSLYYDYIYIQKEEDNQPISEFALLDYQLRNTQKYELVYQEEGADIFKKSISEKN